MKRRRRHPDDSDSDDDAIDDGVLLTPRKKKLRTTSAYIYDTLFVGGQDYDVVVAAMGREWKLHKVKIFVPSFLI